MDPGASILVRASSGTSVLSRARFSACALACSLAEALRRRISGSFPSVSVADGLGATAGSQELTL
jgi:hypothetical protein